jgi:hypothetical protein
MYILCVYAIMAPAHESETIVFNFRKLLSTLPNYALVSIGVNRSDTLLVCFAATQVQTRYWSCMELGQLSILYMQLLINQPKFKETYSETYHIYNHHKFQLNLLKILTMYYYCATPILIFDMKYFGLSHFTSCYLKTMYC